MTHVVVIWNVIELGFSQVSLSLKLGDSYTKSPSVALVLYIVYLNT